MTQSAQPARPRNPRSAEVQHLDDRNHDEFEESFAQPFDHRFRFTIKNRSAEISCGAATVAIRSAASSQCEAETSYRRGISIYRVTERLGRARRVEAVSLRRPELAPKPGFFWVALARCLSRLVRAVESQEAVYQSRSGSRTWFLRDSPSAAETGQ